MIRRLCIIGVGLIGGSLARALRSRPSPFPVGEVVGAGRRIENLRKALDLGVIDRYETDIGCAVSGSDMVVLAVPLGAVETTLRLMRDRLAPDAVITDVGSAKRCIFDAAHAVFGEIPPRLVPGHPIAGTEKSGVEAAFAHLFEGRRVILTPPAEVESSALAQVEAMWRATGAEVVHMDATYHDTVLAATSHLPHVLAYALVDVLGGAEGSDELFRNAAGGLRDFTRIASSDPHMWCDICLFNADPIIGAIEQFQQELSQLKDAIHRKDGDALRSAFARAKDLRDRYLKLLG